MKIRVNDEVRVGSGADRGARRYGGATHLGPRFGSRCFRRFPGRGSREGKAFSLHRWTGGRIGDESPGLEAQRFSGDS